MKKLLSVSLAFSLFFLNACSNDNNDNNNNNNNNPTPTTVSNTLSSGTWRITYYWDTDHEETSNYSGYAFTFGSGNVLTAVNGASTVTGTWVTGLDDSQVKLILAFSTPASFAELSDDWHVTERTDTRIKLEDVSGGGGGTDYLTFEKN